MLAESKSRTLEIEILRILCAISVCLHHLRYCSEALPYGGGYLAVDFFFMVSGFYLHQSYVEKKKNTMGAFEFIWKRYVRLYKDYIIAYVIALLVNVFIFKVAISDNIMGYISEALMLEIGNLNSGLRINPPDWYCGYLLLASFIVYILQKKIKKGIGKLSLFWGIALYALLAIRQGHLCIFPLSGDISWMAVLRAVAGLLIGFSVFEIYKKKKSVKVNSYILKIFFGGGIIIISYMLLWDSAFDLSDYIILPIFAILICVSQFVDIKCLSRIDSKVWKSFSQLSYIVFLNHYVIVKLLNYYNVFKYMDWKIVSALYIFIIFLVSYCLLLMREKLERLVNSIKSEIMRDKTHLMS